MTITVEKLAEQLQGQVQGDRQRGITGVAAIEKAGPADVTYILSEQYLSKLQSTKAGAVIVGHQIAAALRQESPPFSLILVDDAQESFVQALCLLRPQRPRPQIGQSPDAYVHPTARIGDETNIYPGAYIAEDVVIGAGCDIFPGVYIGSGCQLGDGVTLYPNAVLYPDVFIGNRVIIHASAVLGADGFGYRFREGRFQKIPHLSGVRVEDDVEIGAGTTIDRGMIGPTIIGAGTKLDNQVMIAHNCELGKHNAFASQVGLAGSVTTGDYVRCAGQVGIADHVHLGEGCTLGAKSGVHKEVPAGQTYLGAPAGPEADQRRIAIAMSRLPEMRKQLRTLESQLAALTAQMQQLTTSELDS